MKVGKSGVFCRKIYFVTLPFQNGLKYRNGDGQLRRALNVATLYANTVMIGRVTAEKHLLIFFYFCEKNCKHGHIRLIISKHALLITTNYSALIDIRVGIIHLTFVLRSLKGLCYGNQLIWCAFCERRN